MENQKVSIIAQDGKRSNGEVKIQNWTQQQRTKRALKFFAACWGLMLVSIPLPIAHFFLVPGFFLAGPIGAYITYCQQSIVLGGQGLCPKCNAELPIVRAANKWPLTDLCSKCQSRVTIELASTQ